MFVVWPLSVQMANAGHRSYLSSQIFKNSSQPLKYPNPWMLFMMFVSLPPTVQNIFMQWSCFSSLFLGIYNLRGTAYLASRILQIFLHFGAIQNRFLSTFVCFLASGCPLSRTKWQTLPDMFSFLFSAPELVSAPNATSVCSNTSNTSQL